MKPIASHLHLENDSVSKGEDWWGWSVWVEGPSEALDEIEAVTYRLHPTFPKPIRRVTDRDSKFRLQSAGWGEFSIQATVFTKSRDKLFLERWLQLGEETQLESTSEQRPIKVYIAHGLVDAPLVHELTELLAAQGLEVIRIDRDLTPGQAIEEVLDTHLRAADAVIPIFSNPPNSWVLSEAEYALKLKRFVLPVVVEHSDAPPPFNAIVRLQLGEEQNTAELANTIVARVKDHAPRMPNAAPKRGLTIKD